jgi:NADH-quinone oxidoreductase subunit M
VGTALNFDFADPALQADAETVWFGDLDVAYRVGLFDYSLWLVGLTAVVTAAAVGYGFWVGRDRPAVYLSLLLFLEGATIGVFAAQDLVLFYVFWEAMLIPLYVLIGVWGGPGRLGATYKFVAYTMAGSLLMLVAIIAAGLGSGSFDMRELGGAGTSTWIFLGFAVAFAVKAPIWPFHGWLPDAYRESTPEVAAVLSGVISKTAAYGFLAIALPFYPEPAADWRTPGLVLASIGLVYGSLLAFRQPDVRSVVAYSSMGQMGLITLGVFAVNDLGLDGAVLHSVTHGLVSAALFLLAGMVIHRCGTDAFTEVGGMAKGRPLLATAVMTAGILALAVPGSANFAGEFLILAGVFDHGWGFAVVGASGIVLAAMYSLRLISGILHERRGPRVADEARDLRPYELALVVPLLACLLALSAWPAAISERSFPDDQPERAVTEATAP